MRLSEVSARSNTTCCGEFPGSGPWWVGWACRKETLSKAQGEVTCSAFPLAAAEVQKAQGQGSQGEKRKPRRCGSSAQVGVGVNRVVANYRAGRDFRGGLFQLCRPPALPFCRARTVSRVGSPQGLDLDKPLEELHPPLEWD